MNLFDSLDTIAAIATPPGGASRGIVRLSGPRAWAIGLAGFSTGNGETPAPKKPTLFDGELTIDGLRNRLPASIALWPAPRTYTGQALAEIHTTGSVPVLQCVLADRLARGARAAEPGEFTLRAFLSGRIDLTQAEAVLGVIDAANPAQFRAALRQLAGGLSTTIAALRDRLIDTLAHLEAGLDFVDEADVDPVARTALAGALDDAATEVADLANHLEERHRPEGLPRVVLVGPPNAGKSRLFNALAGEARAIVSPIAGTTRDYLVARCEGEGMAFELIDTAGIEEARDELLGRAQELRAEVVESADLLLDCGSRETGFAAELPDDVPSLRVSTKADLAPPVVGALATSAESREGIAELRSAIASALRGRPQGVTATGARCRAGLLEASRALRGAAETLMLGGGDELVAIDVRIAVDELGKVTGAVVTDDILDRIFRRFCIGK